VFRMLFQIKDSKLQGDVPPQPDTLAGEVVVSADTRRENRIPPNQARTKKWPVLDTGVHPSSKEMTPDVWQFDLFGLIEESVSFTWDEFQKLPRTKVFAEINCIVSKIGPRFSVKIAEQAA